MPSRADGVHADHLVAVGNEALTGGIHDDLHVVAAVEGIGEGLDVARAVGGGGAVGARVERAAAQSHEVIDSMPMLSSHSSAG